MTIADGHKTEKTTGNTEPAVAEQQTVTLTQARLDEIIKEAYARAFKKSTAEIEENELKPLRQQLEAVASELKKLQESLASNSNPNSKEQRDGTQEQGETVTREELEALLSKKDEEFKRLLEQKELELKKKQESIQALLNEKKRQAIEVAASKHGAIDPAIVAKLLVEHVCEDEQWNLYVKSEKGGRRINDRGDPMTVEEFVAEFLNKNPYLLRPDARSGGGSMPPGPVDATKSLLQRIKEAEAKGDVKTSITLKRQLYEQQKR